MTTFFNSELKEMIKEWAEQVVHQLSGAAWELVNSNEPKRREVVDFLFRMVPNVLFNATMHKPETAFFALRAARDRIVDEVRYYSGPDGAVRCLEKHIHGGSFCTNEGNRQFLEKLGLLVGKVPTNLGRECYRELQKDK